MCSFCNFDHSVSHFLSAASGVDAASLSSLMKFFPSRGMFPKARFEGRGARPHHVCNGGRDAPSISAYVPSKRLPNIDTVPSRIGYGPWSEISHGWTLWCRNKTKKSVSSVFIALFSKKNAS